MLAVLEPVVRPERAQERLLEGVVRTFPSKSAPEEPEHLAGVLGVERLERRDRRHDNHHPVKRGAVARCEACETAVAASAGDAFRDLPAPVGAGSERRESAPADSGSRTGPACRLRGMRVAVVGHVEWIRFVRVDRVPAGGEIAHSFDDWEQAGGGGGVAAVQLALLADEAHLFTDARQRRPRAPRPGESSSRAGWSSMRRSTSVRSAGPSRRSTTATSGRSRPSAPSSGPAATTTRFRGTSWRRWTPSSSSRATSTPCSTHAGDGC